MEQLIECVCVGPPERRYYLCTLCKLTVASHTIIKHVLSFDHLHCYFKKWHPSGLMAKEAYYYHISSLPSMMLDFAKKTEKIHGKPSAEMKQVILEPDKFRSVNFNCYAQALKELDPMIKEGSLVTAVKPGNKQERHVASPSEEFNYKIRCQDCSMIFENDLKYFSHVKTPKHQMSLEKLFKRGEKTSDNSVQKAAGWKPQLGLYQFVINSLKRNTAAIGVSLVVMCVSTDAQTNHFYLCFACEECFLESRLQEHLRSRKHLIHTLLYQNPWRLPFAWVKHLDVTVLRSMALEEEKERGPDQMVLKVFDIPYRKSINFQQSFPDVMTALQLHHAVLKREVPRCEMLSKLQGNDRFPLLGERFLVKHSTGSGESTDTSFLCLLCKRRLTKVEWPAHVFSREHVESFLQKFHPGSVNCNTVAEILDMAKQAARIHPKSHVQVVNLEHPIWEPCSYERAINILAFAKKREGKGKLEPPVVPQMKLVPRVTVKKEEKDNVTDTSHETSQTTQGSQKQISVDSKKTPPIQIPADAGATVTRVKTENNVENSENKEPPGQKVQSSDESREAPPKSIPDKRHKAEGQTPSEIKIVECWTLQEVKEEQVEKPVVNRPVTETSESCRNTGGATAPKVKEEACESSCAVLKELQDGGCATNKRKRPSGMSDQSQEGTGPGVDEEKEKEHKKFCHPSKTQSWSEDPPDLCHNKQKEARPVGTLSEFPAQDEGYGAIYKFQCAHSESIYFCARCYSLSIPERDIISHLTGSDHREMSFTVLDLPEELYHRIAHQKFKEAIREVMVYQSSCCGPNSVTYLPAAQHGGPSVPPDTQQVVHGFTDDLQVIDMDVDIAEDTGAQPCSETAAVAVTSAATSGAAELPPPSSKDLKKITADSGSAGATVSKSAAPSYATNTSCLHPVSKQHNVKADINSSTTAEHLETKNIPHVVEKSENAAASHSALTSTAKEAAFKGPARPPDATPATVSSSAPDPSCTRPAHTAARFEEASAATTKQAAPSRDPRTVFSHIKNCKSSKAASQPSVGENGDDAKASANTGEKPVQPNAQVTTRSSPTAAPHPGQSTAVRSADKHLPKGPSDSCRNKEKPRYNALEVGVDQLISVECGSKRQVYCQLCSYWIRNSSHVFSYHHKLNWAKMFVKTIDDLPPSESKLDKIVIQLVGVEKELGPRHNKCQRIRVDIVQYDELHAMPVDRVLERLKEMLRQRDSSTSDRAQASELQPGFTSPSEVSSPDHEQDSSPGEERSQSDGGQGFRGSEVDHLHPDQLSKNPELVAAPGMKEAQKAVVRTEINQGRADPLSTDSKPVGTFQNGTIQNASSTRPRLDREPDLLDVEKKLEGTRKMTSVKSSESDPRSSATEPQNQLGPSRVEKHEPNRSVCTPRPPSQASQALSGISRGERIRGRSNLSVSLDVSGCKPIIGLGSMWECRGVSLSQLSTFFLCESCAETISNHNICKHMSSNQHQFNCTMRRYPQHMNYWDSQDITGDQKIDILKGVADMLSGREINEDARVVLLREDVHDYVQKAPFSEALKMVQNIDAEPKQSVSGTPRRDESREKTEKSVLQQTVICSNVKEDLDSDACHSPWEASNSLSEQPEVKPSISPSQPDPEVPSECPSSSGSPTTSQTLPLSPKNKFLPCRKRPAEEPLETLIKSEPNNSEPDGALRVKSTCDHSQQPASQASPESDFSSTLLSPEDKNEDITSDKHEKALKNLAALIRQIKSKVRVAAPMPGPPHAGTPCTGDSSQSGVEKKSKQVQTSFKVIKTEKCQTDLQHGVAMVKQIRAEADSSKMSPMAAAPASCENQQLGPNATTTEAVVASGDPQENIQTQSPVGNLSPITSGNVSQTPGNSSGGQQLHINAIITPRTSATKHQFGGSYKKYDGNRGNKFGQIYSETAPKSSDALAASGQYSQYNQMSSVANKGILSYCSAGTVTGHTTPGDPAEYNQGLYSPNVFGQIHVHPEQESNGFLPSAASTGHMSQEMQQWLVQQQQFLQQQRLLQQQQQQFMQQLHVTSWTSATLPATGSNEAAAGAFTAQANGSQIFGNLNQQSAVRMAPTQMSDNTMVQNFHRVYPSSFFTNVFPAATGAFVPQAPVNSFFAPDRGFISASPAAQVQHDTMH